MIEAMHPEQRKQRERQELIKGELKIANWLLSNVNDLKAAVKDYIKYNDSQGAHSLGYLGRKSYEFCNIGEVIVISNEECESIVKTLEASLYNLDSDLFDIYCKYFDEGLRCVEVAGLLKLSVITIKRRVRELKGIIIKALYDAEFGYESLKWFRLKFSYIGGNVKKVS